MPKVVLEFNLPEEKEELQLAQKGSDYAIVISELANFMRGVVKYQSDQFSDDYIAAVEKIREKLVELEQEYQVERI